MKIAVVDSGIDKNVPYSSNIVESFFLKKTDESYVLLEEETKDFVGHGTAISNIIYNTYPDIEFLSIRICDEVLDIEEDGLLYILEYLYELNDIDIINISAGITHIYDYHSVNNVCNKINKKDTLIVSAFDNDGAISFPASLDSVIGVDIDQEVTDKQKIKMIENSIVNLVVSDRFYRTLWKDKNIIVRGTSFACAFITGLIAKKMTVKTSLKNDEILKTISNEIQTMKINLDFNKMDLDIRKAIVFPLNKESHALVHFKDSLNFEIVGIYDDKFTGKIGTNIFGEKIESFEKICWNDDFDTVILSCNNDLSRLTNKNYEKIIQEKCIRYNKNLYSFETQNPIYYKKNDKFFYPMVKNEMFPSYNKNKLHKVTIPVVGVFGTSSKQGKFTLQNKIILNFKKKGYSPGFISTEPSGYLFGADHVLHYGYKANLNLDLVNYISILNEMIWDIQKEGKDIVITGAQSGITNYNDSNVSDFTLEQQSFLIGTMPDISILCINPHDEISYIKKSINYINSITEESVKIIVIYPFKAEQTTSGIGYKIRKLDEIEIEEIKIIISKELDLPVFCIDTEEDIKLLVKDIIDFFSE